MAWFAGVEVAKCESRAGKFLPVGGKTFSMVKTRPGKIVFAGKNSFKHQL